MPEYRTHYQPAWIDFSMFWSMIVIGVSLATIVQLESTKPSLLAIGIAVVTVLVAIIQVLLHRLVIHEQGLKLVSLFKSNTLEMTWPKIKGVTFGHLTVILKTKRYGQVTFVLFGKKRKQKVVSLIQKGLKGSAK